MPWDPIYWEAGRELRSFGYPFIYRDIPIDIPRYPFISIETHKHAGNWEALKIPPSAPPGLLNVLNTNAFPNACRGKYLNTDAFIAQMNMATSSANVTESFS